MILRGLAFAGEGDLVDARMLDDRGAGGRAVAGDDVDHAVGNAGLLRQPRHPQAGERRLLGRLHHDRAAGGQGRAPLPGHHQHREVPRDDLPDDADRLAARVAEVVAADRESSGRESCRPSRRSSGGSRSTSGRSAARASRIGLPLSSDSSAASSSSSASIRSASLFISRPRSRASILRPRAVVERLAGGLHGQVDVGRVPFGDLGDHLFGGRVDRVERLAAGGGDPLAADEALGLPNLRPSLFGGHCRHTDNS